MGTRDATPRPPRVEENFTVRVSHEMREQIDRIAAALDRSRGYVARKALERGLPLIIEDDARRARPRRAEDAP